MPLRLPISRLAFGRALAALFYLAGLFLISACREAAPTDTITFMVSGGPEELRAYETLVESFHQAQQEIQVSLIHVPGGGDFRQKLAAMYAADAPPDVFLYNFRRLGLYAETGAIFPVHALLDASTRLRRADFYPATLAAFTYRGELQCLPQNLSSPVIYYNQSLFDQAGLPYPQTGWTLEDFLATARALTIDKDGDGSPDQYGFGTEVETIRLAPFLWQFGGEFLDDLANPTRLTLDTPEARAALQWFIDLQMREGVVPGRLAEQASSSENRFLAGNLAMYMSSRVSVPTLRTITSFAWDAAPLPARDQLVSVLHSDGFCISAQAAQEPARLQFIWSFIEYALSETGQTLLAETGRIVPSLEHLANSPAFLESAPPENNQVWLDAAAHLRAFPIHPAWNSIEEMLSRELQRAYYGDASLDEIIRAAEEATAQILATEQ